MTNQQAISHLENMKWLKGYDNTSVGGVPLADIIDDIIGLLREQEPVRPVKQMEQTEWTVCGHCHKHLISKWVFCPYCGRTVSYKQTSDS